MRSTICTLFEGNYHHGVGALVNSLHKAGFRGDVFAGHRGALPRWAANADSVALSGHWPHGRALTVTPGLRIVFIELETAHHLTNYKPEFMLALLDGSVAAGHALFYLDPDIVVTRPWRYFDDWVGCGVALCEDLNSPLPENHPRRVGWRRYYATRGMHLHFRGAEYVNGGFVGVLPEHREFLQHWQRAMELMAEELGSLSLALTGNESYKSVGFADCFDRTDQDGLNVAMESCGLAMSVIGKEAMAFKSGPWLLPHALGASKPWQRNYLRCALNGVPPRPADKAFWSHVSGPIATLSTGKRLQKTVEMALAAMLGRLYRRA